MTASWSCLLYTSILRNILITVGIMGAATIVCLALQHFSEADTHVPLLFVLAVVIVARFTEGYVYGILSAMAAVVLVNYVFTYQMCIRDRLRPDRDVHTVPLFIFPFGKPIAHAAVASGLRFFFDIVHMNDFR